MPLKLLLPPHLLYLSRPLSWVPRQLCAHLEKKEKIMNTYTSYIHHHHYHHIHTNMQTPPSNKLYSAESEIKEYMSEIYIFIKLFTGLPIDTLLELNQ